MWSEVFLTVYLFILSIFDIKSRKLPGGWLIAGAVGGMIKIAAELWRSEGAWGMLWAGWVIGVMPGVLLLLISWLTGRVGKGDGMVFILIGIWTEGWECFAILIWSLLLASVFALFLILGRKKGKEYAFPYIPFVAVSVGLQEILSYMA